MMESQETQESFIGELVRELRGHWRTITYAVGGAGTSLRNWFRRLRRLEVDYIVIPLNGPLPERSGPPRSFIQRRLPLPDRPLTMELLNRRLRAVADAPNVTGVVFLFQGLTAGLATLQNLRRAIQRLQEAGKRVVVFTPYLDMPNYFVASAADKIIVPPMSRFEVIGIRSEAVFLKDALDRIGIKADVVQISPFKTAYNELGESDMTPEQRQQLNWILDDAYEQVTTSMASGRDLPVTEIVALIDRAPMSTESALTAGLIDDIAYEDTLPELLGLGMRDPSEDEAPSETSEEQVRESTGQDDRPAKLLTWSEARPILLERRRRFDPRYIGVISLEGVIAMGPSRRAPIPIPIFTARTSGESTLSNLLRRAEKDSQMAALIIHIDSGGGAALASDLIWRQVKRIAQRMPVIAYMGNLAASGGYYVAAAGQEIFSQPLTLTGSIGVVVVHISTEGFFEQLSVKRVALKRGERANIVSDIAPLTEEELDVLRKEVADAYQHFKELVADSRDIAPEELDQICQGRVWTGRQAADRKLVDDHGDFQDAIARAAELAGIRLDAENDVMVHNLYPGGADHVLPEPFEAPAELLRFLSREHMTAFMDKPLFMMPMEIKLR